ncbi:MAG: hypothetical protein WBS54_10370 [Acidobacteriota bacterium]
MRVRTLAGVLVIVLLLAAVVPLHQQMVALHDTYPSEFRSYYIPSSAYLKVACLGQDNFAADLIFIWSIQYFDRYKENVRDTYLLHTYDVITDLDPRFYEAYIMGNLFLSLDKKWDMLYALSDKGIAADPKDWLVAWDAGTYAFFQAHDYAKALKYFHIAYARNPNRPILKDMLANAYKYQGDYESSLHYWQSIAQEFAGQEEHQASYFRFAAERNIFDLTIKIDLRKLTAAMEIYRKEKGTPPPTLRTLVTAGYLKSLPVDPDGKPYLYDPKTGAVTCQTPFKFRGKFGQW